MSDNQSTQPVIKPWYREPWPWVAIGIPAAAVIMGLTTLYLALAHPDHLVVDDQEYNQIKSELRAQVPPDTGQPGPEAARDRENGGH